jgi:pyruvate/2-oxoglutarate dehydrogenase complex dihydrolipoamide dehydrogenase (E3) component
MSATFNQLALKLLAGGGKAGRWLRLRHAFPVPSMMLRALRSPGVARTDADLDDHIVVIGSGWASLAFVQELAQSGYRNVTIITRDDLFGGKCVNFGCMPTEFILSRRGDPIDARRQALREFVAALRSDVAARFQALRWPIVRGTVASIQGSIVVLEDGTEIPFDRLAVAMGSHYPVVAPVPLHLPKIVSMEDFWNLPPGARVVIHAQENVAAISLGEAAMALGLVPTILLSKNRLRSLPSFRHLLRRVVGAGVAVHQSARLIRVDDSTVTFVDDGKTTSLAYDHLLCVGRPVPSLPQIDGRSPTIFDLDFASASLPSRPDIVFVGDSAGYFTASEAETQARMVARSWTTGAAIDLDTLAGLPASVDGPEPLCMVGSPWTYAGTDWAEIDFRTIGWSKVHQLEGKLWYLLDPACGMIEAVHICHANAKELIAVARLLMAHPVADDRWLSATVHPTAAEIFRILADHAVQRLPKPPRKTRESFESLRFQLPALTDLSPGGVLPDWLSPENAIAVLTSAQPRRDLAACFAAAKLALVTGEAAPFDIASNDGLLITCHEAYRRCSARRGPVVVSVDY